MTDRLKLEFSIGSVDLEDIEKQVASAIKQHERDFHPYFERLIDIEDARYTVIDDSLVLDEIYVDGAQGIAHGSFGWEFYAGCRDLNSSDTEDVSLVFGIEDNRVIFDIELPPIWRTAD